MLTIHTCKTAQGYYHARLSSLVALLSASNYRHVILPSSPVVPLQWFCDRKMNLIGGNEGHDDISVSVNHVISHSSADYWTDEHTIIVNMSIRYLDFGQ